MEGGLFRSDPLCATKHAHAVRARPLLFRGPQRQAPCPALPEMAGRGSAAQPAASGPVRNARTLRQPARGPEPGGPASAPCPAGTHPWQRHAVRPPHGRHQHGRGGGHLLPLLRAGGQHAGAAPSACGKGSRPDPGLYAGMLPEQQRRQDYSRGRL